MRYVPVLLAFTAGAMVCSAFSFADDSLVAPVRVVLPKEMKQLLRFSEFRDRNAVDLIALLENRTKVKVHLDQTELERTCKKPLKDIPVIVSNARIPFAIGVELIANQIRGTLQENGNGWRIVPGPSHLTAMLTPSTENKKRVYAQAAPIKAIEGAPADDIFEFLGEKYDLSIIIAPGPFDQAGGLLTGRKLCRLPPGQKSVINWVEDVAEQLGAEANAYEECILISRKPPRKP
jgi:hypothetical protein